VYDVLYTIDTSGFRISSPNKEQNGIKNCILLMGDSFTFGEGVMDEETYPYKVGLITKGSTRTINLGLTGYGPHHMLALIESSSTVSSFKCTPSHVIYLAIPHHVSRVAGKAGRSGPRYIMSENGGVHRQGAFGVFDWNVSSTSLSERIIRGLKNRSNMLRFWNGREPLPTDNDLKLFSSIVRRLRVIGGDLWPDAKFHILSWNVSVEDRPSYPRFRTEIQTTGWEIHDIHEAFPG
jgi:hypothetical protein